MQRSLKVALIGIGNMGSNHLRVLSMMKSVELVFVYDSNSRVVAEVTEMYGVKGATDLLEDLKLVDAVIIATPTFTHFELLQLVSNYVNYIFVEKPLTDSLETTKVIEKIAKEKGVYVQVGFIERFNPVIREIQKILKSSDRVINIDFTRTNRLSNRIKDVDVIIDLMIHDIDLAIFLNGKVRDVFAYGTIEGNMIAYSSAILMHENGVYSRLTASRVTEKRIRQVSVTCSDMYVDCDLTKKELSINKQTFEQSYHYISLSSVEENVYVTPQEPLLSELMSFVEYCLRGKQDNIIPDIKAAKEAILIASEIQYQIKRRSSQKGICFDAVMV